MDLTPEQLRYLREQRGLSREELAAELGDCSASTVNKWERGMHAIPGWVADKLFSKMEINFTVAELSELFDLCRQENLSFSELLQESARLLIATRKNKTPASKTPVRQSYTYIPPQGQSSMVAEDEGRYTDKTGTED